MTPDCEYLRRVARGEIVAPVKQGMEKGTIWSAIGGLFQLRRHEEAGFIEPLLTAQWPDILRNYPREFLRNLLIRAAPQSIVVGMILNQSSVVSSFSA